VVRIGADGELKESAPCKHCAIAIKEIGIKKVQYSTDDGEIVSVLNRDIDLKTHKPSSGFRCRTRYFT
jgi:deoxycytidylate deaminase